MKEIIDRNSKMFFDLKQTEEMYKYIDDHFSIGMTFGWKIYYRGHVTSSRLGKFIQILEWIMIRTKIKICMRINSTLIFVYCHYRSCSCRSVSQRYDHFYVPSGAVVQWCNDTVVQWYRDVMVQPSMDLLISLISCSSLSNAPKISLMDGLFTVKIFTNRIPVNLWCIPSHKELSTNSQTWTNRHHSDANFTHLVPLDPHVYVVTSYRAGKNNRVIAADLHLKIPLFFKNKFLMSVRIIFWFYCSKQKYILWSKYDGKDWWIRV